VFVEASNMFLTSNNTYDLCIVFLTTHISAKWCVCKNQSLNCHKLRDSISPVLTLTQGLCCRAASLRLGFGMHGLLWILTPYRIDSFWHPSINHPKFVTVNYISETKRAKFVKNRSTEGFPLNRWSIKKLFLFINMGIGLLCFGNTPTLRYGRLTWP